MCARTVETMCWVEDCVCDLTGSSSFFYFFNSFLLVSRERLHSGLREHQALCHMTKSHHTPHHVTGKSQETEAPNNKNNHSRNMWYAAWWRHYLLWNLGELLGRGFACTHLWISMCMWFTYVPLRYIIYCDVLFGHYSDTTACLGLLSGCPLCWAACLKRCVRSKRWAGCCKS